MKSTTIFVFPELKAFLAKGLIAWWLAVFMLIALSGMGQDKFTMRVIEIHGEFLGNHRVDQGGILQPMKQMGAGISSSVGTNGFGGIVEYDYRRLNLEGLGVSGLKYLNSHEFYFGVRYLPMRPTIVIGETAIRLTLGAMYGLDLEPNWRGLLFGGFSVSPFRSVSGLFVNVAYRPGTKPTGGYQIGPGWLLRVGFLLGPTAE